MTYRTAEIEILRYRHAATPITEKVYGLFDDDRLVIYSPHRHDLAPSAVVLNRVKLDVA